MSKNYHLTGIGENTEIGKRGPRIKNNGGIIEHRNQADNDYAVVRGSDPINDNDLVTKRYLETRANIIVTGQINGGSPPAPAAAGTIYVCTTSGGAYTENYLYRSDGTQWVEIAPIEGMRMAVTDDLTGGNIEFQADHLYMWDADGALWVDLGPSPAETGIVKTARVNITYADTGVNLIKNIPAGSIATKVQLEVTQLWDDSAPYVEIGDTADPNRLMEAKGSDLAKVDVYVALVQHMYGSATDINVTLSNGGGTPTQGQATVLIQYDIA